MSRRYLFSMYLVQAGLGLACRATDSNLPLAAAAARGELATVRQLLAAGADVDEVDDSGWSAVIRATRQRELSTLTALLEAGADPDRSDTRRAGRLSFMPCISGHSVPHVRFSPTERIRICRRAKAVRHR